MNTIQFISKNRNGYITSIIECSDPFVKNRKFNAAITDEIHRALIHNETITIEEKQQVSAAEIHPLALVEDCIKWAAQNGYCFATGAAAQLGNRTNRKMIQDQPLFNSFKWINK